MSVTEFKRGVPTYKDNSGNEYGMLCETKEVCVTDNDGVSLEYKLQNLLQNISDIVSGQQKVGKAQSADSAENANKIGGQGADSFAKTTDLAKYLPLTGGETRIKRDSIIPIIIENTTENTPVLLSFSQNGGTKGGLGFNGMNIPVFRTAQGVYNDLLHTGNSAKVVISQTAPSDTSVLWVW